MITNTNSNIVIVIVVVAIVVSAVAGFNVVKPIATRDYICVVL